MAHGADRSIPAWPAFLAVGLAAWAACLSGCRALPPGGGSPAPAREWRGEPVAEYARCCGLKPTVSVDLGNGVSMEFVLVPAGTFQMGSPAGEKDRKNNEQQHEVVISRPFYMSRYAVTQKQYNGVTGEKAGYFTGNDNPVESVSWNDAMTFCRKVSEMRKAAGRPDVALQLPTEAQWEFACRAGTTAPYYGRLEEILWCMANSDYAPHPVGGRQPNAFGLYDMLGNVAQWCRDAHTEQYETLDRTDPLNAEGAQRMTRGGSWNYAAYLCRAACRDWNDPDDRLTNLGFRVVWEWSMVWDTEATEKERAHRGDCGVGRETAN